MCLCVGMRASLRYTYCVFVCWYACFSEVYLLCVCVGMRSSLRYTCFSEVYLLCVCMLVCVLL